MALAASTIRSATTSGCQFLNAAAEYPDPGHPVRAVIDHQRMWLSGMLRDLSTDLGHPDHAARMLVLLHDGAFQGAELDDATVVRVAAYGLAAARAEASFKTGHVLTVQACDMIARSYETKDRQSRTVVRSIVKVIATAMHEFPTTNPNYH
ncbi:hypothetical protein [Nonomuraea sp. NPDC049480]|uniref:hypothetical protein n=1 Tax=Nonomuraea sp. NPDC049480 TaxID=3364353 RepID=UPI0037AF0971